MQEAVRLVLYVFEFSILTVCVLHLATKDHFDEVKYLRRGANGIQQFLSNSSQLSLSADSIKECAPTKCECRTLSADSIKECAPTKC